ncbi:MAG: hypothetical protein J6T41_06650 [Neisseriaceae bacterium]|nr:hypothetical protein [Neisseriaceae bacterium]
MENPYQVNELRYIVGWDYYPTTTPQGVVIGWDNPAHPTPQALIVCILISFYSALSGGLVGLIVSPYNNLSVIVEQKPTLQ